MSASFVLARVLAVASELDAGGWPEDDGLTAVVDLAASTLPTATPGERLALSRALSELEGAVTRAMERTSVALRDGGLKTAALRGYIAVRPHTTGQNVRSGA